jgi:pSer/pThr/pTyr-binding forkhead associated (FHA) protein
LPPGSALLVVARAERGSRFLLDRDVTTAGRHPDSDIFLDDVTVSRRRVGFRRASDGFSVASIAQWRHLDRERSGSAVLSSSDEVQIGSSGWCT